MRIPADWEACELGSISELVEQEAFPIRRTMRRHAGARACKVWRGGSYGQE
jgi:hypothetical protein